MTTSRAVVLRNPSSVTGDSVFWDTQAGTCWQKYESLGHPIPPKTTCTIQVGFHPTSPGSYSGTLVVQRCVDWTTDPTYGFVVCSSYDGSQNVSLAGTGEIPPSVTVSFTPTDNSSYCNVVVNVAHFAPSTTYPMSVGIDDHGLTFSYTTYSVTTDATGAGSTFVFSYGNNGNSAEATVDGVGSGWQTISC